MKLDKFKPAWAQLKVINQIDQLSGEEIIRMIDRPDDGVVTYSWQRIMKYAALYSFLMTCFQG